MEKFGCFIGQLAFTAVYMVVASLAGHLANVYIALFCVGMFFLSIAGTLMMDHSGIARMVVFWIGMLFLLVPSFVLNIIVIVNKSGSLIEISYFAACVAFVIAIWFACGYWDGYYYMFSFFPSIGAIVLGLIIKGITASVYKTAVTLLVMGLIALVVLLITRIKLGSALND